MSESFAEYAKTIANEAATTLKQHGYRKKRNGFNRSLQNGLIHQISVFSVGAYSIHHGQGYFHAGCFVPEAELYRQNGSNPKWVNDYDCAIRGTIAGHGEAYFSLPSLARRPVEVSALVDECLNALAPVESYEGIAAWEAQKGPLRFETPKPIVMACLHFADGERERASQVIREYLEAVGDSHPGHTAHVKTWAEKNQLL